MTPPWELEAARTRSLRWWIIWAAVPLAVWALVVWAWRLSGLDEATLAPWAGPQGFPLRGDPLYEQVLHIGGRRLSVAVAAVMALIGIVGLWRRPDAEWARSCLYLVLVLAISSAIVGLIKAAIPHPCPWELVRWGGDALTVDDPSHRHHGWPAGHAAGAFGWLGAVFVARWHGRSPLPWVALVLALGLLFAWTQHVRGAHFPSHNLWTLAICWLCAVGLHALRARLPGVRAPPAT